MTFFALASWFRNRMGRELSYDDLVKVCEDIQWLPVGDKLKKRYWAFMSGERARLIRKSRKGQMRKC